MSAAVAAQVAPADASTADRTDFPTSASTLPGTSCPVFPADNFWNTRIDRLPLHRRSAAWLSTMQASTTRLHPDFGPNYGEQSEPYGIPITIARDTAFQPVTFEYADESDRVLYPLDGRTRIEGGPESDGDRHAIVVDPRTCTLYETWHTRLGPRGWTAGSGAVWALRSNRLRPRGWTSADAAGLPILPGLLRWDEVAAGRVTHAIRFTADLTSTTFLWPARHQAGATDDPSAPPMGARFRLRADFPLRPYSAAARVVLRGLKEYGLVLADNGTSWYFQGAADDRWPARLVDELKSIPAAAFEAVDTSSLRIRPGSAAVRVPRSAGTIRQ